MRTQTEVKVPWWLQTGDFGVYRPWIQDHFSTMVPISICFMHIHTYSVYSIIHGFVGIKPVENCVCLNVRMCSEHKHRGIHCAPAGFSGGHHRLPSIHSVKSILLYLSVNSVKSKFCKGAKRGTPMASLSSYFTSLGLLIFIPLSLNSSVTAVGWNSETESLKPWDSVTH